MHTGLEVVNAEMSSAAVNLLDYELLAILYAYCMSY